MSDGRWPKYAFKDMWNRTHVGVGLRWQAVEREDVHQVVELAVYVTADGELGLWRYVDGDHGRLGLKVGHDVQEYPKGVLSMELLLPLERLHELDHELGRDVLVVLEPRALVARLNTLQKTKSAKTRSDL